MLVQSLRQNQTVSQDQIGLVSEAGADVSDVFPTETRPITLSSNQF